MSSDNHKGHGASDFDYITYKESFRMSRFEFELKTIFSGFMIQLQWESAIQFDAYTTENSHVQPWKIYAQRPYKEQTVIIDAWVPSIIHFRSAQVEWRTGAEGSLFATKADVDTYRGLIVTSFQLIRGNPPQIDKRMVIQ